MVLWLSKGIRILKIFTVQWFRRRYSHIGSHGEPLWKFQYQWLKWLKNHENSCWGNVQCKCKYVLCDIMLKLFFKTTDPNSGFLQRREFLCIFFVHIFLSQSICHMNLRPLLLLCAFELCIIFMEKIKIYNTLVSFSVLFFVFNPK